MQTLRGQTAVGALRLAGPGGTHSISKQFLGWLPPRGQDTHPNVSQERTARFSRLAPCDHGRSTWRLPASDVAQTVSRRGPPPLSTRCYHPYKPFSLSRGRTGLGA